MDIGPLLGNVVEYSLAATLWTHHHIHMEAILPQVSPLASNEQNGVLIQDYSTSHRQWWLIDTPLACQNPH